MDCKVDDLVDFELCLMDSNPSCLSGVYEEFVSSGRLDNLGSCFGSISAFTDFVLNQGILMLVIFTHGDSSSPTGAQPYTLNTSFKFIYA